MSNTSSASSGLNMGCGGYFHQLSSSTYLKCIHMNLLEGKMPIDKTTMVFVGEHDYD
jgi:hypothetical protein